MTTSESLRERLLRTVERRFKDVEIEDVGTVRLRSLSELERSEIEDAVRKEPKHLRAALIQKCCLDEQGHELFGPADISRIVQMDSRVINALWNAINEHLDYPDKEAHEKNSESGLDGDSLSN